MASQQKTVDAIVWLMADAGDITSRKMFGEYAIYCGPKMVASVCDDQLFVKPTVAGRALGADLRDAPPYPGAKPNLLVPEAKWNDREWLVKLIRATAAELPMPKPKIKKGK